MRKIAWLGTVMGCLAAMTARGAVEIRSDYPGGNVKVEKVDESAGAVTLRPDLRDTKGKWFHFDFVLPPRMPALIRVN